MARFGKLTKIIGGAALLFALPMLAVATQADDLTEASHFVSSGRMVNGVANVTPDAQAAARAQIWALTQQPDALDCDVTENASCFATFQAGSAQ